MDIGSEFELDLSKIFKKKDNIKSYLSEFNTIYMDSGRSALRLLLSQLPHKGNILLPEYICESVIECFPISRIRFYKIKENFEIDVNDIISKIDNSTGIIYVMHYFGVVQPESVLKIIKSISRIRKITIIEDTTHSIFTKPSTIGDYMISSLRKWISIPRGGVLYWQKSKKAIISDNVRKSICNDRAIGLFLKSLFVNRKENNDFWDEINSIYRNVFFNDEDNIEHSVVPQKISDFSNFLLECYDVNVLINKRRHNCRYLIDCLNSIGLESAVIFKDTDCPIALPLRIKNRDEFRKYMIENNVFCAVHWPKDRFESPDRNISLKNAKELISIPIDQRYSEKNMAHLFNLILEYEGL